MSIRTVEEKKKAISLAKKLGPTAAATKLGLPEGTVSSWCFKARKAKSEGGEWPAATARGSRRKSAPTGSTGVRARRIGPLLVSAEVEAEPAERTRSNDVSWELETERGGVLRVRRTITSPELERVLVALLTEESLR